MVIRHAGYELRPLDRWQYKLYRVVPGAEYKGAHRSEDGEGLIDLGKYPSSIAQGLSMIRGMLQREGRREEVLSLDEAIREVESIDGDLAELIARMPEPAAGGEGRGRR